MAGGTACTPPSPPTAPPSPSTRRRPCELVDLATGSPATPAWRSSPDPRGYAGEFGIIGAVGWSPAGTGRRLAVQDGTSTVLVGRDGTRSARLRGGAARERVAVVVARRTGTPGVRAGQRPVLGARRPTDGVDRPATSARRPAAAGLGRFARRLAQRLAGRPAPAGLRPHAPGTAGPGCGSTSGAVAVEGVTWSSAFAGTVRPLTGDEDRGHGRRERAPRDPRGRRRARADPGRRLGRRARRRRCRRTCSRRSGRPRPRSGGGRRSRSRPRRGTGC